MIDGHGDDGWIYGMALRADFSSNVFYGALDSGLRDHLRGALDAVTHYPEAGAAGLRLEAAAAFGVEPRSVLVTNGATEAIYLIAQAFRSMPVTVVEPTFAEYGDACTIQGMVVSCVSWEEWSEAELRGLVFVCNPNNPTGKALAAVDLLEIADRWPEAIFVIDESYIEFTQATSSVVSARRPNILVLRSLTKSCRIPGLRVGFLIGPEKVVARVAVGRMPWSVNRLAIEAGLYIFRHRENFVVPVEALVAATAEWRRELSTATAWRVWDTNTHYFLFEGVAGLKERLVERYGLLVRDAANFKGLGPHHFRVACQSSEQNRLLTEALRECSHSGR
jgi:threonine-phosphate decarboxylase